MHDATVSRARIAARQFLGALTLVVIAYLITYSFVALVWAVAG